MCSDEEWEKSNTPGSKNNKQGTAHVQSTVKWADIEKGIPPEQHEIEVLDDIITEENLPPEVNCAQTKLEHLLEPSSAVPDQESPSSNSSEEIEFDTLEAHAELIKKRGKHKAELQAMNDQPNPFLPDGEVAKDAQSLLQKMKTTKDNYNTLEYESLSIESPQHSEDFASTELNFEESPKSAVALSVSGTHTSISGSAANCKPENGNDNSSVGIVNRGLIVSAKTDTVEHVVIPEKKTGCCLIL